MIEEVKRIKLDELNKKKIAYEKKLEEIKRKMIDLQRDLEILKKESPKGITVRSSFTFWQRHITKRKEYLEYKRQSERVNKYDVLIKKTQNELDKEQKRVEDEINDLEIYEKLKEIEDKKNTIEKEKTLYGMGITPIEAIKLLEENGIQPVLSEADKVEFIHPRNYSSKEALIGVHKTRYAPTANCIKSAKDAKAENKEKVIINGVEYEYSYKIERDTVHMAINNEVSSFGMESWDDCKYAILIPLKDIPNEKIGCAAPMDTFTMGSIEISEDTWILCPKNEVNTIKAFNPKANVIGYEGENVMGFSGPFLTQLGYRAESLGMWAWSDIESEEQYVELMNKEKIEMSAHSNHYSFEDENVKTRINKAVSLCKLLKDNHLINRPEDINTINTQLEERKTNNFGRILDFLREKSNLKKAPSQAIKANNKQADIFFQEMEKNGFYISEAYKRIIRKLYILQDPSTNRYKEETINRIFDIPEELTEEERKTIEEFHTALIAECYIDEMSTRLPFEKFISAVVGETIIHAQERESLTEKKQEEK